MIIIGPTTVIDDRNNAFNFITSKTVINRCEFLCIWKIWINLKRFVKSKFYGGKL